MKPFMKKTKLLLQRFVNLEDTNFTGIYDSFWEKIPLDDFLFQTVLSSASNYNHEQLISLQ